uniref:Uncharacterized protein n=1 Tax=Moniliophthora roreri TaxID=221103 RepID=A0A0W0FNN6_MONRR
MHLIITITILSLTFPAERDPHNEQTAKLEPVENLAANHPTNRALFDFSDLGLTNSTMSLQECYSGLPEEQARVLMEIEDEIAG